MNSSIIQCYIRCSCGNIENTRKENTVPDLITLDSMPVPDWEYYHAWIQCIKIRYLVSELQEKMRSGVIIHDLVEEPTLQNLSAEMHQLWWETEWKEEELQVKYFKKLWQWKENAERHYENFKLILETRVTRNGPEYRLEFRDKWESNFVPKSDVLPVQAEWCPVESFWQDSRRYDYGI